MSNALELTTQNFDSTVSNGITVIDFWAEWCAPCHLMTPILDKIAQTYNSKVTIAKVNVDDAMELAQRFQISAIPTLLVMKDGDVFKKFIGVTQERELAKAIDAAQD